MVQVVSMVTWWVQFSIKADPQQVVMWKLPNSQGDVNVVGVVDILATRTEGVYHVVVPMVDQTNVVGGVIINKMGVEVQVHVVNVGSVEMSIQPMLLCCV